MTKTVAARIPVHEPQWFVFHQRSQAGAGEVNIGHLAFIPQRDVDARKLLVPDYLGYIGEGHDLEAAIRRAVAINRHGGWEHLDKVDIGDIDFIEIGGSKELAEARGLPVAFESGDVVAIRTSDVSSLDQLARSGILFTVAASTMTSLDMWPEEPADDELDSPSL